MKNKLVLIFASFLFWSLASCIEQAKEADIDGDGSADILVKRNKLVDLKKQDNIFVYDGVVVNAITNDQWQLKEDQLAVIENPTFKMVYDSSAEAWKKMDNSPK